MEKVEEKVELFRKSFTTKQDAVFALDQIIEEVLFHKIWPDYAVSNKIKSSRNFWREVRETISSQPWPNQSSL
jgi:hypothetical protein